MVWRPGVRLATALGAFAGGLLLAAPPAVAAGGFTAALTELPARFTAGPDATTVTAVVSTDTGGDCLKVRWSMVLRVQGLRLDQIRVERVEEDGSFPLEVRADGNAARLTDAKLDPGTLCRDRTVTAHYRFAFADDVGDGRISLQVEAYDANLRLLARTAATREVVGGRAAVAPSSDPGSSAAADEASVAPIDEPTEAPVGDPSAEAATGAPPTAVAQVPAGGAGGAGRPSRASVATGIGPVQAAFLLGGLLLFLGVGLLLRLRHLLAGTSAEGAATDVVQGYGDPTYGTSEPALAGAFLRSRPRRRRWSPR